MTPNTTKSSRNPANRAQIERGFCGSALQVSHLQSTSDVGEPQVVTCSTVRTVHAVNEKSIRQWHLEPATAELIIVCERCGPNHLTKSQILNA